jgi:hypothetical protein
MQQLVLGLFKDLSSGRHQNDNILPIFPMPIVAFTMPSSLRLEDPFILKMKQSINALGTLYINVAAFAPIAAAWPSFGHEFFPAKCKAPVASIPCRQVYSRTINKHLGVSSYRFPVPSFNSPINGIWKRETGIKKKGPRSGSHGNQTDWFFLSGLSADMNEFAKPSAILKLNNSGYLCKKSIVASYPHIRTRLKLGAALPDENSAAINQLAGKTLHTQPLGLTVSSISGAAHSLFMCHDLTS